MSENNKKPNILKLGVESYQNYLYQLNMTKELRDAFKEIFYDVKLNDPFLKIIGKILDGK